MERKKMIFFTSVSASVLLASSLLVACTATDTGPGSSMTASSTFQEESESSSLSVSNPTSSQSTSRSSASQNASASSSRPASSSGGSTSSQAPAPQQPQSTPQQPPPQAQASQPECAPEPIPTPTPIPEPPPAPAPSANIDGCLSSAAAWASGNNMAVNDALYIGAAGYENPIDTTGKTDAQVTDHLLYQLGLIHSQLATMPEFDPGTTYPCYKFVVDGSLIYVLYG